MVGIDESVIRVLVDVGPSGRQDSNEDVFLVAEGLEHLSDLSNKELTSKVRERLPSRLLEEMLFCRYVPWLQLIASYRFISSSAK